MPAISPFTSRRVMESQSDIYIDGRIKRESKTAIKTDFKDKKSSSSKRFDY